MSKQRRLVILGLAGLGIIALGLEYLNIFIPSAEQHPAAQSTAPAPATFRAGPRPAGAATATPAFFAHAITDRSASAESPDLANMGGWGSPPLAPYGLKEPPWNPRQGPSTYTMASSAAPGSGAHSARRPLDAEELQFLNSSLSSWLRAVSGKAPHDSENPFSKVAQKDAPEGERTKADPPPSPPPSPAPEPPPAPPMDELPKSGNTRPILRFFGPVGPDGGARTVEAQTLGYNRFRLGRYGVGTFDLAVQPHFLAAQLSVTIGDFNNDGIPDLVVADRFANTITVLLGLGHNTYRALEPFQIGYNVMAVATGDFNGDGNLDLVVASAGLNNITILLGNGDGSFNYFTSFGSLLPHPKAILVGDINGDGIADLILMDLGQRAVMAFVGDGTGRFTPAINPPAVEVQSIPTPDWYLNARVNSIEWIRYGPSVSINVNLGPGAVESVINYMNGPRRFVGLGDFSGEGQIDMAVGTLTRLTRE